MHANNNDAPLLHGTNLWINTPQGRPLIRDLNIMLAREQVALLGRNGVGKSSLLDVLAREDAPHRGRVRTFGDIQYVPQTLNGSAGEITSLFHSLAESGQWDTRIQDELQCLALPLIPGQDRRFSNGELRKLYLLAAKLRDADLLLLDEPSQDLDEAGLAWLLDWLGTWDKGLICASHDRRLLSHFQQYFLVAESGCSVFSGSLGDLDAHLDRQFQLTETRYRQKLNAMLQEEEHFVKVRRRRRRKKNFGRISELDRCSSRARLNEKRSQAQVSQGRLSKIRRQKIECMRKWTLASRRAIAVNLPLDLQSTKRIRSNGDLLKVRGLSIERNKCKLLHDLSFTLGNQTLAVIGPNGAGKTSLVEALMGDTVGHGTVERTVNTGYIAQGAANWRFHESLAALLLLRSDGRDVAQISDMLAAHRFPLALADRPMISLSPGERLRAALIILFRKHPTVELLVLDEPTDSLDYFGETALIKALQSWSGGLLVTSHNQAFLEALGVNRTLHLHGQGEYHWIG